MSRRPDDTSEIAKLFRCPSCGASLEVVDAPSVTCNYCGNSVPVPAHLRPQKPDVPQIVIQPAFTTYSTEQMDQTMRTGSRLGCIITLVVLLFAGGLTAFILSTTQGVIDQAFDQVGEVVDLIPGQGSDPGSGFADLVMEFGGLGNGAGQFEDPRYIAVDPDGNIFVADYQDGRVQKFNAGGKFEQLINIEPDSNDSTLIRGTAADYEGNLYVVRGGDILKYSTEGGRLVETLPGEFPDTIYDDVAVDASNTIWALHSSAGEDDLLKLSSGGEILERWPGIVSGVDDDNPAISLDMTVDGAGNVYIASGLASAVYIYDANGKYVDRFGEEGTDSGQLNSPRGISVDGQNRVYVSTFSRVDAFDKSGRFLGTVFDDYTKGVAFGTTVDLGGHIYIVTNQGKVLKYRLRDER